MNDRATQVSDLLLHRRHDSRMGLMLAEQGKLVPKDIESILSYQQQKGVRFGEAAISLGLATDDDVKDILARQFDYAYMRDAPAAQGGYLVAAQNPSAPEVEEIRVLRSELKIRWFNNGKKALAVVCVDQEHDSNLLAANLGVAFSQLGMRTVLIDANLRRPRLHHLFGSANKSGLSDILARRANVDEISAVDGLPDLFLLTAGTPAPNPQELLSRHTFNDLQSALKKSFDIILYALPEYSSAKADVLAVAAAAEGGIVSACCDRSRMSDISEAIEHLMAVNVAIVGSVLMQPSRSRPRP